MRLAYSINLGFPVLLVQDLILGLGLFRFLRRLFPRLGDRNCFEKWTELITKSGNVTGQAAAPLLLCVASAGRYDEIPVK